MVSKEGASVWSQEMAVSTRQTRMERLAHYDRDLSFKRVQNDHPRTLTSAQIDFFNDKGYLLPFDIFDDREIAGHRASILVSGSDPDNHWPHTERPEGDNI